MQNQRSWLGRFFTQPCKPYRNFQIVFVVLALNFLIPAASYSFAPAQAVGHFVDLNTMLGGAPYPIVNEVNSHLWRYLAAANVMTLGLMCMLLVVNLRRFYPVLVPLVFMKLYAALSWWVGWFFWAEQHWFLAAAILDSLTVAAFLYFGRSARRAVENVPDAELVPTPRWGQS